MKPNQNSSYLEVFLNKLKEQSFTIVLLIGIMYYQNNLFNDQLIEYKTMIKEKEHLILQLTEEERTRLIKREEYLIQQRDKFIDDIKQQLKR